MISQPKTKVRRMEIKLESPAFKNGDFIPVRYTCDGENISPALKWNRPDSDKVKNYCLLVEDPDAPGGIFVHWIVVDIPANMTSLTEGITNQRNLPDGAEMGMNGARRIGYFGPCPPSGVHRYFFRIYAIDTILKMEAGMTKDEMLKAIKGHIVAEGELMGKYQKMK
ncbi:MAG: YbhB/YbcL family Raf kinase inhibitor-like protein [Syntrophothermus sp.]